jgi:hypothetical protein
LFEDERCFWHVEVEDDFVDAHPELLEELADSMI